MARREPPHRAALFALIESPPEVAALLMTVIPPRLSMPARPGLVTRWGAGPAGRCKVVALSLRFRVPAVSAGQGWRAAPRAQARELRIPALLGAGTPLTPTGLRTFRAAPGVMTDRGGLGGRLAAFVAITTRVFEGDVFAASRPAAGVLGWYAAAHPAGWRGVVGRSELLAVAAGLAVGLGSVAASRIAGQLGLPLARATLVAARAALGLVASNVVPDPDRRLARDRRL